MLRFSNRFDSFGEKIHSLISRNRLRQQCAPAIFLQRTDKERTLSTKLHGFLVEVVHELVDQRQRDQLDLISRQRQLADENVAAGIKAALCFSSEH